MAMPQPPSPTTPPSPKSNPQYFPNPPNLPDLPESSVLPTAFDLNSKPHVNRPKLAFPGDRHGRRSSVQFAAHTHWGHRAASPKPHPPPNQRRMSSPPPPSTYENRVSFDTFDNRDATDFSFTLMSKHKDYAYSPRSRTFLCGTDQNDYSEFALEWLVDELVEDGDEIVCLRVVDKDSKINSDASLQEGKYRVEAKKLLEHIQNKNKEDEKSINLVLEFSVGKVPETIQRMINIYSPACLIVGTRGRSLGGIQGLLPGSVSKYCLQNSPVPVIVVRPTSKRDKKKRKRLADPNRRTYMDILEQSGANGSQMLHKSERDKLIGQHGGEATEKEAEAVAQAIGLPGSIGDFASFRKGSTTTTDEDGATLTKTTSAKSDGTSGPESPSPVGGMLFPDSPVRGERRRSPVASDEEEEEEDDGGDVENEDDEEEDEDDEEEEDDEDDEGVGAKRRLKAPMQAARKMEAGEGRYLKPGAALADDV